MKMKNLGYSFLVLIGLVFLTGCGILGGKKNSGGAMVNDGMLRGVSAGSRYTLPRPPGMVY
ncbi:MAG: gliding motility-associated lipoprotein, partial [Bacteroidota bacterium]